MKKFVIALMLMTTIIGCKKTADDIPLIPVEEAVIGNWELHSSICGWSGAMNYPAGNGTTITFGSNGQYRATGNRIDSGLYRLSTRTNSQGQIENFLYFGGNWNHEFRFSITGNIFKLDENAFIADGCEYSYQKL